MSWNHIRFKINCGKNKHSGNSTVLYFQTLNYFPQSVIIKINIYKLSLKSRESKSVCECISLACILSKWYYISRLQIVILKVWERLCLAHKGWVSYIVYGIRVLHTILHSSQTFYSISTVNKMICSGPKTIRCTHKPFLCQTSLHLHAILQ